MNKIPVIYYHSVAPEKNKSWYKSYLTLELRYFEDLLNYFTQQQYTFLFLDEYFLAREDKTRRQEKMVCLNFDDGCLDNYVYAFPLLKKYKAKATIFVNPEFVPADAAPRKTLEDVWQGKAKQTELEELGFCSWEELRIMERSGLVDIQSHTLSHTKYFAGDQLREIHNPKANYLYPIANLFPSKKPYYITDPGFKTLLPYGTPFFEEKSAVLAKRVFINPEFEKACVALFKDADWSRYNKQQVLDKVSQLYKQFLAENKIIAETETEESYKERVKKELLLSKQIIEKELDKQVLYCCWPHGDYNSYVQQVAMEAGYKATTVVLKAGQVNASRERFDRIGHGSSRNSRFLTLLKMKYKIRAYKNEFPFHLVEKLYTVLKYGRS